MKAYSKETLLQIKLRNPKYMVIYKELLTYAATNGKEESHVEDFLVSEKTNKIMDKYLWQTVLLSLCFSIYYVNAINYSTLIPLDYLGFAMFLIMLFIPYKVLRFVIYKILYNEINAIIHMANSEQIYTAYIRLQISDSLKKIRESDQLYLHIQ